MPVQLVSTPAKILIVEDDAITCKIYERLLQAHGYQVKMAPDGEFAQASLAFEKPDLVLLDLMLPKVPGAEVLHFIRSRDEGKQVPVIVFSNALQSPMGEAVRMEGGASTQFLSKGNCSPERLLGAVHSALARRTLLEGEQLKPPAPETAAAPTPPAIQPVSPSAPAKDVAAIPPPSPKEVVPEPAQRPVAAPPPEAPAALPAEPAEPATAPVMPAGRLDRNAIQSIQSELRQDFLQCTPPKIAALSGQLLEVIKSKVAPDWPSFLAGFETSLGAAIANAGFAGLGRIARFSTALHGLTKDLRDEPAAVNPATLRTVVSALDFLNLLLQEAGQTPDEPFFEPLVMVVDDEPICRSSACMALGGARMKTISLEDPILALRVLTENRFDLVVTDVDMPGTDGYELCKQLRLMRKHKTTPVVFLTGLSDIQSRARSALSGANEYIVKPVMPSELVVKALTLIMRPPPKGK